MGSLSTLSIAGIALGAFILANYIYVSVIKPAMDR